MAFEKTYPQMTDFDWIKHDIEEIIRVRQFEIEKSHTRESAYADPDQETQCRALLQAEIEGLEVALSVVKNQMDDDFIS